MLRNRIKKIEERLDNPKANQRNIDSIYQFFLTGDEGSLPDQVELIETHLAARKARGKDLKDFPGLLEVFDALKEEEEIPDDESALFSYIKTRVHDSKRLKFQFLRRHGKWANELLGKLGLIKIAFFDFG